MAPATGMPSPHTRFCSAIAKENTSRPQPRSSVIGRKKRPKLWRVPRASMRISPPQTRTTVGVRQPIARDKGKSLPPRARKRTLRRGSRSVDRAGAGAARVAAGATRPGGPRRLGAIRLRGAHRELLLELGARAARAARRIGRAHQRLELVAAGAAGVFEDRHGAM